MPGYEQRNALGHHLPLPHWFWNGDTRMRCLQLSIRQSLQTAHAHHIQRLMVIGNFALLAGLDPAALHRWYLGIYIDAFEWVELPNTLGMSQRADGGLIATKPYVSSAAYLQRMGDYCQGCAYHPKLKTGPRACPFNALYWDFFARHAETLGSQPPAGAGVPPVAKNAARAANRPASARPAGAPAAGHPVTTTPTAQGLPCNPCPLVTEPSSWVPLAPSVVPSPHNCRPTHAAPRSAP